MSDNDTCSDVYVGNLDERVTERILYDILIQAGPVVNLYIPRDKETDKPRGFAFAEYETQETAQYAVKLFSGLVTLFKKTLKFSISGQHDQENSTSKPSINNSQSATLVSSPVLNLIKPPKAQPGTFSNRKKYVGKSGQYVNNNNAMQSASKVCPNPVRLPASCRFQEQQVISYNYNRSNLYNYVGNSELFNGSGPICNTNYDYGRLRVHGHTHNFSRYYAPY